MPNRWTDDSQSLPFRDGSFESKKITSSEARSQNRMMRMECRRNASVIQIMGWRYETKSTIITTNRPIGPIAQLGLVLGDPMAATAISTV